MRRFIRTLLTKRAGLRSEVEALIRERGDGAPDHARALAMAAIGTAGNDHAWQLSGMVDRRFGIARQADTATRYLEAR